MIQTFVTSRQESKPARAAISALLLGTGALVWYRGVQYYVGGAPRHRLETAWIWFLVIAGLAALSGRGSVGERPSERTSLAAVLCIAIAAAFVLYAPALGVGLLSDDFVLVARAAENDFFRVWSELFRPVPLFLFRVIGPRPFVLHAINIALHGVNAALVVRIAIRYLPRTAAWAAGACFLTCPAAVEAVVWCSGLQDVLMTTFTLTAIEVGAAHAGWAAVPLSAALLTKETAVAAPLLAAIAHPRRRRFIVAAGALVGIYVAWRLATRPVPDTYAMRPSSYVIKELIVRAFATLALPVHASVLQEHPWVGAALVSLYLAAVAFAAWRWRERRDGLVAAAAMAVWILGSVAPVYSYFFITDDLAGSRYLYLPAVGWSVLVAILLGRSRATPFLAAALCATTAVVTRVNIGPWLEAAAMRERVLASVRQLEASGCDRIWVAAVPDSVHGAYVFRNGLAEAVRPLAVGQSAAAHCRVDAPF